MSDQHQIIILDTRYVGVNKLVEDVLAIMDSLSEQGFKLKFTTGTPDGLIVYTMVKEPRQWYASGDKAKSDDYWANTRG